MATDGSSGRSEGDRVYVAGKRRKKKELAWVKEKSRMSQRCGRGRGKGKGNACREVEIE